MADQRIIDLNELTIAELESLIASLKLAVDDPSLTDAEGLPIATILSNDHAGEAAADAKNFLALTPKGFYNS